MLVVAAGVDRRPFAQVLRNSLSGHPPTTGLRDIFRFTPVVYYRVIVMGRFWTIWQVVKGISPYISIRCDKTHLPGPMK